MSFNGQLKSGGRVERSLSVIGNRIRIFAFYFQAKFFYCFFSSTYCRHYSTKKEQNYVRARRERRRLLESTRGDAAHVARSSLPGARLPLVIGTIILFSSHACTRHYLCTVTATASLSHASNAQKGFSQQNNALCSTGCSRAAPLRQTGRQKSTANTITRRMILTCTARHRRGGGTPRRAAEHTHQQQSRIVGTSKSRLCRFMNDPLSPACHEPTFGAILCHLKPTYLGSRSHKGRN